MIQEKILDIVGVIPYSLIRMVSLIINLVNKIYYYMLEENIASKILNKYYFTR